MSFGKRRLRFQPKMTDRVRVGLGGVGGYDGARRGFDTERLKKAGDMLLSAMRLDLLNRPLLRPLPNLRREQEALMAQTATEAGAKWNQSILRMRV
jgi:hypothetical protein